MYQTKIVVIGSTNTDMVIKSDHLPAPGETILGGDFLMNPGGKGANQAVAASIAVTKIYIRFNYESKNFTNTNYWHSSIYF